MAENQLDSYNKIFHGGHGNIKLGFNIEIF